MILHEFPIVPLKYSKNSRWNNDFCHHLPFLMTRHTRKIWQGSRATAFPFWMKIREWKVWQGGRATAFPFSIKIRKWKVWQGGRATAFPFSIKIRVHAEVAPPHFYFRTDFPFSRYRRGRWSRHIGPQKESHVLSTYKRQEHTSKTRETCERHARNMRVFPAADYTAPAPFSPSLMGRGYYPCRCHEKVKILKGMYSKWGCPYSQKLLFQI